MYILFITTEPMYINLLFPMYISPHIIGFVHVLCTMTKYMYEANEPILSVIKCYKDKYQKYPENTCNVFYSILLSVCLLIFKAEIT